MQDGGREKIGGGGDQGRGEGRTRKGKPSSVCKEGILDDGVISRGLHCKLSPCFLQICSPFYIANT